MAVYRHPCISIMLILAFASLSADAGRIMVFPLPWASRAFDLVKLSAELSRRGHEVMLVTVAEYTPRVEAMLARSDPCQGT